MSFINSIRDKYKPLFDSESGGEGDGLVSKWGTLYFVDKLADGDLLRWEAIQYLPIEQFYTKLVLEIDKAKAENIKHYTR